VSWDFSRILVDWSYYTTPEGAQVNKRNYASVQTFMWLAMFVGVGELWYRWRVMRGERSMLDAGLLPEAEGSMLTESELKPHYIKARAYPAARVLPVLVRRLIAEFRKSKSVDRVNGLLDSSLELINHRLDLGYTLLRYIVWLLPTLGFVGTVIGIADAMAFAGSGAVAADALLSPTTQRLAVAFYTTLLALVQSGILVFFMNTLQAAEEEVVNASGQYCIDNFIIRLLEPGQQEELLRRSAAKQS
jgi:biopolymer transport protein ExbB/TolQ